MRRYDGIVCSRRPPSCNLAFKRQISTEKGKSTQPLQPLRGTRDLFPPHSTHHTAISNVLSSTAHRYGYAEVRTPIIEHASVFTRGLGADTDIVRNEMFVFDDHEIPTILRPEGTAALVRACINSGHFRGVSGHVAIGRYYYDGAMFRRERPQRGRQRQFQQFGIECIGNAHVTADAEVIELAFDCLKANGIERYTELNINTIGDTSSRINFISALNAFLQPRRSLLSVESQNRLSTGGTSLLRIVDSKDIHDQLLLGYNNIRERHPELTQNIFQRLLSLSTNNNNNKIQFSSENVKEIAPNIFFYLNESSQQRFNELLKILKFLNIPYIVNPAMVRGLDYYTHTAFEFILKRPLSLTSTDTNISAELNTLLSSGMAVCAGGRYDELFTMLGATSPVPAIGWAAGVDRIALLQSLIHPQNTSAAAAMIVAVVAIHDKASGDDSSKLSAAHLQALLVCQQLRASGVTVVHQLDMPRVGKQLSFAAEQSAIFAVIVGDDELRNGTYTVRRMSDSSQQSIPIADLVDVIQTSLQRLASQSKSAAPMS